MQVRVQTALYRQRRYMVHRHLDMQPVPRHIAAHYRSQNSRENATKSKIINWIMRTSIISKDLCNKILMVGVTYRTDRPNGGGVSSVVAAYSKYFEHLRYIPTWKQTNKLGKALFFLWNYVRIIALLAFDRRIEIVHIHAASDASFRRKMLVFKAAKFFGKKIILHMHAGEFDVYYNKVGEKEKANIRKTILGADKLIALSKSWHDYYIKFGKDAKDVIILNNIVDAPETVEPKRTDFINALYLGWLGEKKGVFDLIDVVKEHRQELAGKFKLRLGGFDNEVRINNIINVNGLEEVLELVGWVSGKRKQALWGG